MIFPNDAITISKDSPKNSTDCFSTSDILLASSSHVRTLLYGRSNTQNGKDSHISISVSSTTSDWVDTELGGGQDWTIAPFKLLAGENVYCWKDSQATQTFFQLVYVDYDVTQGSTSTASSGVSTVLGFTYGEVVNSFWLFLIFFTLIMGLFYAWLRGVRVKG